MDAMDRAGRVLGRIKAKALWGDFSSFSEMGGLWYWECGQSELKVRHFSK